MTQPPEVIEIAAGELSEELRRRGIGPDERVTLMIAPDQEWIRVAGSRAPGSWPLALRMTISTG